MLFQLRKIKGTMSKKESKFYSPPDNFFKKKIFKTRAMKTHIPISYKEGRPE